MGVITRLVHRLAGLPPPGETEMDAVSRETVEAVEQHREAVEKKGKADLALMEMLGKLRESRERAPSKH